MIEYNPIKIIDLDLDRTGSSDGETSLREMYLKLSEPPTNEWTSIFDSERRFPRHTMWRRAWIEHDCIVVRCTPEEIKKYHLKDLKVDVHNSNLKYKEFLIQAEAINEQEHLKARQEDARLRDIKKGLDFE